MTTQAPRRRADDWRETSGRALPKTMFDQLTQHLGYRAEDVMAIRMNQRELTVTWSDNGMPRSTRHLYTA